MNEISQIFSMGGYGAYVWPAFAVTTAILVGVLVATLRTLRANEAALDALAETTDADTRAGKRKRKR